MTAVDEALARAEDGYGFRPYGDMCAEDLHMVGELEADYFTLATEVRKLREFEKFMRDQAETHGPSASLAASLAEWDDEAPHCARCGSYSHTSCPVAPWETQS